MALGTVTKVSGADFTSGNKRVRVRDVQLTAGANYTTGGEAITPALVGLKLRIDSAVAVGQARTASGTTSRGIALDHASVPGSVKLQAYNSLTTSSDTEVASNTDLSTFFVRIVFTGA